jgi:SAM-dependent methyltransferase
MPSWVDKLPAGYLTELPEGLVGDLFLPPKYHPVPLRSEGELFDRVRNRSRTPMIAPSEMEPGRCWHVHDSVEKMVAENPPGRVLDLGCGSGREAVWMAANGWKVVAVDHLPKQIEAAKLRERLFLGEDKVEWVCADSAAFLKVTTKSSFDAAISLFGPIKEINVLSEVVAKDGNCIIASHSWLNRQCFGVPSRKFVSEDINPLICGELSCTEQLVWHTDRASSVRLYSKAKQMRKT